jgi:hypothetical protein
MALKTCLPHSAHKLLPKLPPRHRNNHLHIGNEHLRTKMFYDKRRLGIERHLQALLNGEPVTPCEITHCI